ncbi:hypothetical protein HUT19_33020 [Streptomyces sp. NA02950]|uniref:hypothetical protein n=1 Tax=Streptomyces sp. NA02950 TaxID=2742137 RepID=UPI00159124E4|nr:hypothetical protein [Streptomyces sp. NA02950]QKV95964.1 hypothetical protein HUT19_33020 [Streptomyces sp. NA02950]
MLMRSSPPGLRADTELNDWHLAWTDPSIVQRLPVSYNAFCCDRWTVYRRFGTATAGSRHGGVSIARAALRDLGEQWERALRSSSPAAHAWDLLSRRASERRTTSPLGLHHLLDRDEADALVLRYKLGLSPLHAGYAMGLSKADFELLRHRALRSLLPSRAQ